MKSDAQRHPTLPRYGSDFIANALEFYTGSAVGGISDF
jgi:hypothetical protein